MRAFVLSPGAAYDLSEIRNYLVKEAGSRVARRVLRRLRQRMLFLARHPEVGHRREDLTRQSVKFWSVYAYMIVYDPNTRPVEIVRVLHGNRNLMAILS